MDQKGMYGFSLNGNGYELGQPDVPKYMTRKLILALEDVRASFSFEPSCEIKALSLPPEFGLERLTKELYWLTNQHGYCGSFPGYSFAVASRGWNPNSEVLEEAGLLKVNDKGSDIIVTIPPVSWSIAHLLIANAQSAGLRLHGYSTPPITWHLGIGISAYQASFNGIKY